MKTKEEIKEQMKIKLKNSWNKLSKRAVAHKNESEAFHKLCEDFYGIEWHTLESLQDNDPIIDTIDYGTDNLSFKVFDKMMVEAMNHDEGIRRK